MIARGIARVAAPIPRSLRAFSSTVAQQRTPSLADVSPAGVESFNSKQKEFRENLVKAQQEREASTSGTFLPVPDYMMYGSKLMDFALGQRAEVASKVASQSESDRADGLLSRVIYGTKEGRELDAQLEASFSAVLARGKYVHSIVFHEVKPDKVDEYVKLVGNWYPKMASMEKNKVHLVGSWRTEVGDCDTFGVLPVLLGLELLANL